MERHQKYLLLGIILAGLLIIYVVSRTLPVSVTLQDVGFHPPCEEPLLALMVIYTAPANFAQRQVIRTIWQPWTSQIPRVFFVGVSGNRTVDNSVDQEQKLHGDMVKLNYVESYHNLTQKLHGWLTWVSEKGNRSCFILKLDDDVFIDPFQMVELLEMLRKNPPGSNFVCKVFAGNKPIRFSDSKWFVNKEEYPDSTYPPYCLGWAYIVPTEAVSLLLDATTRARPLWVDDVYATGILAKAAGMGHVNIANRYSHSNAAYREIVTGQKMISDFGVAGKPERYMSLWNEILHRRYYNVVT